MKNDTEWENPGLDITKSELKELPSGAFEGDIVVVDDYADVGGAVDYLMACPLLGFDTETRPNFKKWHHHKVALLQLAAPEKAFLFRLNKIGLPGPVVQLLENSKVKKIGAAIRDDLKDLKSLNEFEPGGFVELQKYVHGFGIESQSIRKLAGLVLGIKISKRQQLSNWENPVLTSPQRRYAATDAWVALKVYQNLDSGYWSENSSFST